MASEIGDDSRVISYRGEDAGSNATLGTDYDDVSGEGVATRHAVLPVGVAQKFAKYLGAQPYKEVADLMNWLVRARLHTNEEGPPNAPAHILLPADLAQSLTNYLTEKSHGDAAALLDWLRSASLFSPGLAVALPPGHSPIH